MANILTIELDITARNLSLLGSQQAGDGPERRGLSGAVGAQQGDDFSTLHVNGDPPEHQYDIAVSDFYII
jgi:hypothetical protein